MHLDDLPQYEDELILYSSLPCPVQVMWRLIALPLLPAAALIIPLGALISLLCAFIVRGLHVLQSTRRLNSCLLQPVWAALQWVPAIAGLIAQLTAALLFVVVIPCDPGVHLSTLMQPCVSLYEASYDYFVPGMQQYQILLTGVAALPVSLAYLVMQSINGFIRLVAACRRPSQGHATPEPLQTHEQTRVISTPAEKLAYCMDQLRDKDTSTLGALLQKEGSLRGAFEIITYSTDRADRPRSSVVSRLSFPTPR